MENKIMGKEPMDIQEQLRDKNGVSVPMLQYGYGLRYSQAREFLRQLQLRGWVSPTCRGVEFRVRKRKLFMRCLEHHEVAHLMVNYSNDCRDALEQAALGGATFGELERAVRGEEDTKHAIHDLTDMKLLWKEGDLYFSRVSNQTVSILGEMRNLLNRLENIAEMMDEEELKNGASEKLARDTQKAIEKLFKPLFD